MIAMTEEQQYNDQMQVLQERFLHEHQDKLICLPHQHNDGDAVNQVRLYANMHRI